MSEHTAILDEVRDLRALLVEADSLLSLARFRTGSVTDEDWRREVDDWLGRSRRVTQ
jgi:hypothetical protein